MKIRTYFWNILIAFDQLVNTVLGGDPDETISSRMGKHIANDRCTFCKLICGVLDFFDKDHCTKSVESDEGSRQIVKR